MAEEHLRDLRTLKLRGTNLQNAEFLRLMGNISSVPDEATEWPCLRSLDLRDNNITDEALDVSLMTKRTDHSDQPPPYSRTVFEVRPGSLIEGQCLSSVFEAKLSAALHCAHPQFSDDITEVVARVKASPTLNRRDSYDGLYPGLTHLYISGNGISAQAVVKLLMLLHLEVLDCGTVTTKKAFKEPLAEETRLFEETQAAFLILDNLKNCPSLRFLRVNHQVVTGYSSLHDIGWIDPVASLSGASNTQWDPEHGSNGTPRRYVFQAPLLAIETLVLTSLPEHSAKGHVTECLKTFLQACGDMERVSTLYQFHNHRDTSPLKVLALSTQEIRLELVSLPAHANRQGPADESKTFEQTGNSDFSFFPDENAAGSASSSVPMRPTALPLPDGGPPHPDSDVVKSLAAFRKAQREKELRSAISSPDGETFWRGKLQVIRPTR
ncbi:hypothetical protein H2201_005366 [Coniosporium apollinis]|uniref:Uncharacterized protein n=2 Tax=Coniosporium TaxID=2810619 RepID=A0ABQ9NQ91_9PEZI|nr:hypothetical protein H2199_006943 [Cladosporium sp. JES 115]KAJ9664126.1 hypothetical protein H2201_005366 [Coniosporium apollinis]